MFRFSCWRLALATGGSITFAAKKLNEILDMKKREHPVPQAELKQFLRDKVIPILESTKLDTRGSQSDLKQYLGQLVRDAAFAAAILRARPEGKYVQAIAACLCEDSHRMRFLSRMSSPQASKTLEFLCKVGLSERAVYSVLISRLNFHNLKEVARVMFALSDVGLDDLNLLVVVPMYSGEEWEVASHSSSSSSSGRAVQSSGADDETYNNVYEAVRVLRSLSKSCRAMVEQQRSTKSTSLQVPVDNLNYFRSHLLRFLFANATVLRGAHWVNIARALSHFPAEYQPLLTLHSVAPALVEEVVALSIRNPGQKPMSRNDKDDRQMRVISCEEVGCVALDRLFDYAEGHRDMPEAASSGHLSPEFPFDLEHIDLVKLLPILEHLSTSVRPPSERHRRVNLVLHVTCASAHCLSFSDIVRLLQMLRRMDTSTEVKRAVDIVSQQGGRLLSENSAAVVLQQTPFRMIVQFSASLAALRVQRCDGFLDFVVTGVSFFPWTLSADAGLSIVNALALTGQHDAQRCHEALATITERICRNEFSLHPGVPLLQSHPLQTAKLLRGCVLLDYIPALTVLQQFLGNTSAGIPCTAEVLQAGGNLIFDLSRSFSHFAKQARHAEQHRIEELWRTGICDTILPLLRILTQARIQDLRAGLWWQASYTPVSWRTTLETIIVYGDPQLDYSAPQKVARRFEEALPVCLEIVGLAAVAAEMQMSNIERTATPSLPPSVIFERLNFTANDVVHFLSSLLMLEYLIYQATMKVALDQKSDDHCRNTMQSWKSKYLSFLNSPLNDSDRVTPMEVVRKIFNLQPHGQGKSEAVALLQRSDTLEVTTNLPFAVSLVTDPGPVSDYFTEHCMSLISLNTEADS